MQTSSSRCSTGREHNHWAWNHHMHYFPLAKHSAKVVTYSIQPKLQHKFQAPSHSSPVYSRREAWIHPSCHHEHTLTQSIHKARNKALWKHKDNVSVNQMSWLSQVSEVCNMRHVNTPCHLKINAGIVSGKEKTSQCTSRYICSMLLVCPMLHDLICSRRGKKQNSRVCRNTFLQYLPP